jgi:phospholipid/cholesterol/gamma-HCH transport system permease protein
MTLRKTAGHSGRKMVLFFVHAARMSTLALQSLSWIFLAPFRGRPIRWGATFVQMVRIGVESVPIVSVISFCVGLIIAMQAA